MTSEWWQRVSRQQYSFLVYLPVFFFRRVKPWAATGGLTDKGPAGWRGGGGWDRLSDGCPIHHGGPCWWAKEPTCGGEGEVVSEESALFDYSRSIIQTRAAQNLSVRWQPAEWLLPLWAKSNVLLTRRKRLWECRSGWYRSGDLGESTLSKREVLERDPDRKKKTA